MNYEVFDVETEFGKETHINITFDGGGAMCFPAIDGNPHYEQYLEWLAEQEEVTE